MVVIVGRSLISVRSGMGKKEVKKGLMREVMCFPLVTIPHSANFVAIFNAS